MISMLMSVRSSRATHSEKYGARGVSITISRYSSSGVVAIQSDAMESK